jgi:serine/threonine protein kinase
LSIEPGQQLSHYRLIEKIGEGGMGLVWKAEDTKLHRRIALKVLPEATAADPDRRARFEREARAVAALSHPNIVTLHSVEESDGVHFITMELVEGRNLTEFLPKDGFPLSRLLEIAIPLADAVSSAHRAGITHRDLKPDNVMIDGTGRLRVLDFGLAKLHEPIGSTGDTQAATVTSDTAEGRVLGTVAYMSPEQAEGKSVDARSDIFSLGTIFYEMASGTRPFRGDTTMSTISSILKDEPSSITELKRTLPRHAGRIIRRCLAKDPDRRYQTALDLRNELEELKTEIDSGTHAAEPGGAASPSRRSRLPVLVGVVGLIAIAVVVAIQFREQSESPATSYTSRPVTASTALDFSPSWSFDGNYIAFSRMTSGNQDIYVTPVDGGNPVVRAPGPGDQVTPRWSPDGGLLAYVSTQKPGTPVFLIPPDGGTPRELIQTNLPALDYRVEWAMGQRPWSADGKTLLVSRATETARVAVHRVTMATREAEQITFPPAGSDDYGPSYSFDGQRIAFRRQTQTGTALMSIPVEGGEAEDLYREEPVTSFAWRPDNRHVVVELGGTVALSSSNLYDIDLASGRKEQLTSGTGLANSPSVSADNRLVYTAQPAHDTFLYLVEVETGKREQITSHSRDNGGARFGPDGRTIAYASDRTGDQEIWLHYLDGRPEKQFTDRRSGDDRAPEWSPDGQRLVFLSDRDGAVLRLFIANADGGGGARPLVDQAITPGLGGASIFEPVSRWSPDGESIAYRVVGAEGNELWTVGPDGLGARKRLDGATGFDWYRGSRQVVVTRRRGSETELSAVDLESGREQTLFVGALQEIDVAPDGSAVAFCYGRGHYSMGLAVLKLEPPSDPDGLPTPVGEPEYVVRTEGSWHVHNGGWSPDSKYLVYTQDRDYGDLYELVEEE